MATIDWKPTLAQLDAAPTITTPAGQSVLQGLVSAGQAYDSAGKPDVLYESTAHKDWSRLLPSQRLGQPEPSYYGPAYYARPSAAVLTRVTPPRDPVLPDGAPTDAKTAYAFWRPRDPAIGKKIAEYYIGKARELEEEQRPKGPTSGAIEQSLVAALSAAQTWLAA
jgi:hypothetical protein